MSDVRLGNLLGAAALALSDRLETRMDDVVGMGGEAPAAVATIGTRPERSIEHLRTTLGLSHSGAVRLVDRLEDRGWVERRRSGGRSVHLALTARGKAIFREILEARRTVLEHALGSLDAPRRRALEDALATLLEGLPSGRAEAWRICRLCEHGVCRDEACPVGRGVELDHHRRDTRPPSGADEEP